MAPGPLESKEEFHPGSRKPRPLAVDKCANLWPGCRPTWALVRYRPDFYRGGALHSLRKSKNRRERSKRVVIQRIAQTLLGDRAISSIQYQIPS